MFRSEVVWKRSSAHSSSKRFSPVHDTILFYSKGESYHWKPIYQPLPQDTIDHCGSDRSAKRVGQVTVQVWLLLIG